MLFTFRGILQIRKKSNLKYEFALTDSKYLLVSKIDRNNSRQNYQEKYKENIISNHKKNLSLKSLKFRVFNSQAYKIYCSGQMLHQIQMSKLFVDSKTFVDMPIRQSQQQVLANFAKLSSLNPSRQELKHFLSENFYSVGEDIINVQPLDWAACAPFISNVKDQNLVEFGRFLHQKWKKLLKKHVNLGSNCFSSILDSNYPFMVPGGRFIEYYYWDTYYIIHGLLCSGMYKTAKGLINNLLEMIEIVGFVPNGSRVYYLNRSQPPMLTQMVYAYFKKTNDLEFLKQALHLLDEEYSFWMQKRVYNHTLKNGRTYKLNLYNVKSSEPRPESYKEDYINAHESSNVQNYYSNVISAAESGWDFSSRWFNDPMDIKTIAITQILPVDLNAIMLKNEKTLYEFHKLLSSSKEVICFYKKAIDDREEAINECLWDSKLKTWGDLNYATNKLNSTYVYISDLTPLWAGITLKPGVTVEDILLRYRSLLMDYKSGIPASNICSQHQWDFPNVWAPYHLSTVELLLAHDKHEMALDIAQRFVNTTYVGWLKSNKQMIFEKYNANNVGVYGEGGEYFVQEGFGWTNGVVIKFLELFGEKLKILGEY